VLRRIDGFAYFCNARHHAGGSLVVNNAHGLDSFTAVGAQFLFDRLRVGAVAPVAGKEFGFQSEPRGHSLPQRGEVSGFRHQYALAGREHVDERGFPRASARRRIDDDLAMRGLEDALHSREHRFAQRCELGPAVIHGRKIDRAQNALGHVGRPGNLQEMSASVARHRLPRGFFASCIQ
jgi:hypothetical protein